MHITTTTSITNEIDEEIVVTIVAEVDFGDVGDYDNPPTAEQVDIESVTDKNGEEVDLSPEMEKEVEAAVWARVAVEIEDHAENAG